MGAVVVARIRPWADGDLALLHRLHGDPAMTEHIGGPQTSEQIRERHARYLATGPDRAFCVVDAASGEPAGWVGYWEREWQGEDVYETGWTILHAFQGRGLATVATVAALQDARDRGVRSVVHAFPSVDNPPSNAVCRRLGMELQGTVDFEHPPGHWHPCHDWRVNLSSVGQAEGR